MRVALIYLAGAATASAWWSVVLLERTNGEGLPLAIIAAVIGSVASVWAITVVAISDRLRAELRGSD